MTVAATGATTGARRTDPWRHRAMSYVMVDVESDGPIPGDYSMICFGAVIVEPDLARSFYGQLRPISDSWIPDALEISGFSREETLRFEDPVSVMTSFRGWLVENAGPRHFFISDTTASTGSSSTGTSTTFSARTPSGSPPTSS